VSQSWIAIVISLLALWVAYPGYAKKAENLFLTKSITDTCSLWHYQQYHAVSIGLCWSVTIENISEDTVILQDFTLQDLHRNENEVTADRQFGHLQDIEHTGGTPLQFPVSVINLPIIVAIKDGRIAWLEHGRNCAPSRVVSAIAACGKGLLGAAVLAR
jgi:hypothetical protein